MTNANFFTSGIGPDILMNALEGCITVFVWAAWFFFNFYLKQKQRYSIWSFTENANFNSFHGKILSRYSEIYKFKTNKDSTFQKYTKKHTKKTGLIKATSSIRRLLASLDIHYNNILNTLNTEVQKQNKHKLINVKKKKLSTQ